MKTFLYNAKNKVKVAAAIVTTPAAYCLLPTSACIKNKRSKHTFFPVLLVILLLAFTEKGFAQCAAGSYNGTTMQLCYDQCPSTVTYSLGTVNANTYMRLAVIQGFTYRFTLCSAGYDSQITVRNDAGNYLVYDDDDGPDCSGTSASVDYTATYTGYVRVQVNDYNCSTGTNPTLYVEVVAGSNTIDNQALYGSSQWKGYVYDGTNLNTYIAYYTEPVTFNENFGSTTGCGTNQLYANGVASALITTETFSVRYRMNYNLPAAYYVFTIGGDDGVRLSIDGGSTWIINHWVDEGYTTYSTSSLLLSGSTNFVFDYYENGGGNQASFSYTCAPTITSFSPSSACSGSGTTITINGAGYVNGGTTVTINGVSATPVTWVSSSQITVPLPGGASGTGNIVVTTCAPVTSGSTFTVNPLPSTTASVSPTTVCAGGSVTLTGGPASCTYSWTGPTGCSYSPGTTFQSPTVTVGSIGGAFTLTATNGGGCSAPATTASITINSTTANAGPNQYICSATTTTATMAGSACSGCSWSFVSATGGTGTYTITPPGTNWNNTITNLSTGTYVFRWSAGCGTAYSDVVVNVQ